MSSPYATRSQGWSVGNAWAAARRVWMFAFVALVSAAFAGDGFAAEAVGVRAFNRGDYGRIEFDWKAPVAHEVQVAGRHLKIHFDRPFEASLDTVRGQLSGYLAGVEMVDDQTVVFVLKRALQYRSFARDGAIVVDLFDGKPMSLVAADGAPSEAAETDRAEKPEQPAEPPVTKSALAAERPTKESPGTAGASVPAGGILVRGGEHSGFSRLVFDWPTEIRYAFKRDGKNAEIEFGAPADLDIGAIEADPPAMVAKPTVRHADGHVTFAFATPENATIRAYRSETKVVLDISAAAGKTADAARAADAQAAKATEPEAKAADPNPIDRKPAAQAPAAVKPAEKALETSEKQVEKQNAAVPAKPAPTSTATSASTPAKPLSLAIPQSGMRLVRPGSAGMGPASGPLIPIKLEDDGTQVRLSFAWPNPVAAAAFERAGYLWILFDQPAKFDVSALQRPGSRFENRTQILSPGAGAPFSGLRLEPSRTLHASMRRNEASWIVELADNLDTPSTVLPISVEPAALPQPRVFLPAIDPGAPIAIDDPEVGDNIIVVPLRAAGRRIADAAAFGKFTLPETAQGVVVEPRADDLSVRTSSDGISITSTGNLYLSARNPAAGRRAALGSLFDWSLRRGSGKDFVVERQERIAQVLAAPERERNPVRLKLAQFYFAHSMIAETLGVLAVIESQDSRAADSSILRALRGAGRLLNGNVDDAAADLEQASLDGEPEIKPWRALLAAQRGRWTDAIGGFDDLDAVSAGMPSALVERFQLVAAESAVEVGQYALADEWLRRLAERHPGPETQAEMAYLRGRIFAGTDKPDEAIEAWQSLPKTAHRDSNAKAELARIGLLSELGRMSAAEALPALERLRYAWRGDRIEFAVLQRLADAYGAAERPRDQLATLRNIAQLFPNRDEVPAMKAKMADIYADLFLAGGADKLAPITALAIFREFKELTPASEPGTRMMAGLVDRLLAVDLVNQAVELQKELVEQRLAGTEKLHGGLKLATIELSARRPEAALKTIDATAESADTAGERRMLRARALAASGRTNGALAALAEDDGREADLLRAEIQWNKQRWADAGRSLARALRARLSDAQTLSDVDQGLVLKWAVALALAGETDALAEVRRRYGTAMEQGSYGKDFDVVSSEHPTGPVPMAAIAGRLAEVGRLESALGALKSHMPVTPVAATTSSN